MFSSRPNSIVSVTIHAMKSARAGIVPLTCKLLPTPLAGAQDRQKVYSFLRRSARVSFYSSDSSSFDDLCIQADQSLFNKVLHNLDHVLHRLLPPVAHNSHNYCLRPRAHDRSIPERLTNLTDCNFIIRMLFYQVYWLYLMPACFHCLAIAFWQLSNTRICYDATSTTMPTYTTRRRSWSFAEYCKHCGAFERCSRVRL